MSTSDAEEIKNDLIASGMYDNLIILATEIETSTLDTDNIKLKLSEYNKLVELLLVFSKEESLFANKHMPKLLLFDLLSNNRIHELCKAETFNILPSHKRYILIHKNTTLKKLLRVNELKSLYQFTQCPVCLEVAKTYPLRNCVHTYCKSCTGMITKLGTISCPLCRVISESYFKEHLLSTPSNNS